MSKHLEKNELENYGESNLSPREFLRVQAHLETCEDCTRRLNEMFPNIVEREEALLLEDLTQETMRDFHLNYDEHLKPFIYGTIDSIDKEIVESHVEICAECREDLRDLLSFHEELEREKEIRELSKPTFWKTVSDWFSAPNRKMAWLAFAAVLVVASVGFIWFFVSRPKNEIVQNPANSNQMETNQTLPNVNQTAVQANQNAPKIISNSAENQNSYIAPKEIEIAALVLPKFLNNLKITKSETLRGNNDSETQKIAILFPNGIVIRNSSPILSWENAANVENYEVSIFDNDFNRISKIENLKGNSWRVPDLAKGKIYQWQVSAKTVLADGKTQNFLGQGKFYIVSQADENKINQVKNSLEKGKAFAEAGLLTEAANEFRKYLKENPNSENAKRFLRQIEQAQK